LEHSFTLEFPSFGMHYDRPPQTTVQRYRFNLYRVGLETMRCAPTTIHAAGTFFGRAAGFYWREREESGVTFRWAQPRATVYLPPCDDNRVVVDGATLFLVAKCPRVLDLASCKVTTFVNGQPIGVVDLQTDYRRHSFAVPPEALADNPQGTKLVFEGPTFIPAWAGDHADQRTLSFALHNTTLVPDHHRGPAPIVNSRSNR
jgi:hypothetical protein